MGMPVMDIHIGLKFAAMTLSWPQHRKNYLVPEFSFL